MASEDHECRARGERSIQSAQACIESCNGEGDDFRSDTRSRRGGGIGNK